MIDINTTTIETPNYTATLNGELRQESLWIVSSRSGGVIAELRTSPGEILQYLRTLEDPEHNSDQKSVPV